MKKTKLLFVFTLLFLSFQTGLKTFAQLNRIWATYYGGTEDEGGTLGQACVATDLLGNVYITGYTNSYSGIASGGFQNIYGGGSSDAFLVKFDSDGNRLWATYYGGIETDWGYGIATDALGNIFLAGWSDSPSGIASGGFQNILGGIGLPDAFLVKFDSDGNRIWATYYGGPGIEAMMGSDVVTDDLGNVYLSGLTWSDTGIASGGFQNTYGGGAGDAFLVKFDPDGNRLWATYYGGDGNENDRGGDICVDGSGNVYLAGTTTSTSGIASGGFQNVYGGGGTVDTYLVKFDENGNRIWATYYGETGDDGDGTSVAANKITGEVYLLGSTNSSSGIAFGGFQNTLGGIGSSLLGDAFLVKFDSNGNRIWATYYGGPEDEEPYSVAVNASGVYIAGDTYSNSGIASNGYQNTFAPTEDCFIAKFDSDGNRLWGTYYGGSGADDDEDGGITVDEAGNVYLRGATPNTSGIAFNGFQNTYGGATSNYPGDAFLVKFNEASCITPIAVISGETIICNGQNITLTASGGGTYSWNNGTTSSLLSISPTATTTYTVVVFSGSCSATATAVVTVSPPPSSLITGNTSICAGDITTLNASGGGNYSWNNGATSSSITISPTATTTYTVVVTVGSCSDTSSAIILVNPLPAPAITGNNSICAGDIITLTAAGGSTYIWNNGTTGSSITVSPTATATYTVVAYNASCSGYESATVIVYPAPTVVAGNDVTISSGGSTTLIASGGTNYTWSNGSTGAIIVVSPTITTVYCVTVRDANGCSDNACVTVTIETPCGNNLNLSVPNIFTPNNDGANDEFIISNINNCKDFSIQIFDRWGILLFQTTDPTLGWNGTFSGNKAADGAYYYVLFNGEDVIKKGFITLIR